MTVGDVIAISHADRVYHLKVLETKPGDAISVIETDVEVDFAPPPGYVEPAASKPASTAATPAPAGTASPTIPGASPAPAAPEPEDANKFVPFAGQGQTLRGRPSPSAPKAVPTSRPYAVCPPQNPGSLVRAEMTFVRSPSGLVGGSRGQALGRDGDERPGCSHGNVAAVSWPGVVLAVGERGSAGRHQGQAQLQLWRAGVGAHARRWRRGQHQRWRCARAR